MPNDNTPQYGIEIILIKFWMTVSGFKWAETNSPSDFLVNLK